MSSFRVYQSNVRCKVATFNSFRSGLFVQSLTSAIGIGLFLSLASAAVAQTAVHVPVQVGTRVPVKILEELSSQESKKGKAIKLSVTGDLVVDGRVIVAKGAPIWGTIREAKKSGRFGSDGELEISVDSVHTIDGKAIRLMANLEDTSSASGKDKDKDEDNAAEKMIGALPGGSLATGLFKKGSSIVIPADADIPVFTASYMVALFVDSTAVSSTGSTEEDEEGSSAVAEQALALVNGIESWGRALGAVAAHKGSTPQIRAFGVKMVEEHTKLQSELKEAATKQKAEIAPLVPADQQALNDALKDLLSKKKDDERDEALLNRIYGLAENVLGVLEEGGAPGLEEVLGNMSKVWADNLAQVAKLMSNKK